MFGERLKELRKGKGLTQKELGTLLNISDRVIGYYEADRHFPDGDVLLKLSEIFDVSIDYLLGKNKIKKSKFDGLPMNDALNLAFDVLQEGVKEGKQIDDNKFNNLTDHLIKKLIKEGVIIPDKEIDQETMTLIKKSIEIEASLAKNRKKDTKE